MLQSHQLRTDNISRFRPLKSITQLKTPNLTKQRKNTKDPKSQNPMSRFELLTLTLLLLLSFTIPITASEEQLVPDTVTETDELEELIAIDEEEQEFQDQESQQHHHQSEQQKEAEVLSKAQRIVLELNNDNANRVIEGNEYVMVLGYAPWCVRSAELMPHFAVAANKLKELGSSVLMAKLDAERYPKVASLLGIKGFPTLLLFVNGSSQAYTGGFEGEDIVIWARKKTGDPVIRISSVTEAEEFLKKKYMFVIGLFQKFEGPDYEEFVEVATSDNEIQFVEANNIEVAKVLFPEIKATKSFIGLVKSEPERYSTYDGVFKTNQILEFLSHNKFPLVTKLTELNSVRVYSSPIKLQVIVFADTDNFKSLIERLQEVARKFKSKIMFIYIDIAEENLAKPFLTLLGLEDSESTVVAAFDNNMNTKYLLQSDPTPSNIEDFCSRLLHGNLSPHFKSQPVPDNKDAAIQIVVGKTFDELVLSSPENVILEVLTPWCINCETTTKQVEKLAKHFKGLDSLVFARIDASANEHPKLQEINDYPTLLFYPANNKAKPIKLPTKSSAKDLAITINKQLKMKENAAKDEL